MTVRGRTMHNNHNTTLYCIFTVLSPLNLLYFHNGFLSGPYLGKYKMD